MSFPLALSRYLRPYLDGEELVVDNGVTGRKERLAGLERDVVIALWDRDSAGAKVARLVETRGQGPVFDTLTQLSNKAMVFPDDEAGELLFDQLLEGSCPSRPFVDQIELTNHCPMRCRFCPRGTEGAMTRPRGFMDLDLFRRLLAQLHPNQASYRPLELHHLGESLLHPQVVEFVRAAREAGLRTEMSVNPALLTPALGQGLLEAGLSRLVVSLDGMDEETLRDLRGPAARFSKAVNHLETLLDKVAQMKTPPRIVIQMLDLQRNQHQHDAFLERWNRRGLPTVTAYIKDLDGVDPDLGAPSSRPLVHLCTYPWKSVVVLWDGRVVPCCRDADAQAVLGDLSQKSLAEIWRGREVASLRHHHRRSTIPEDHLCHDCAWLRGSYAATMEQRHPAQARPDPLSW